MGQFQGVPGPSQDAFDAQTQAIAKLASTRISDDFTHSASVFEAYLTGNIVTIFMQYASGTYTNNTVLATIPIKYKPKATSISPVYNYDTGVPSTTGSAWAQTAGDIRYFGSSSFTGKLTAFITYAI